MLKQGIIFLLSLFYLSLSSQDIPSALQVEKYTLDNGLTIYLNEDHSATAVMGMVAVKGGSKRDPQDATGVAHYFEHIMFKGTDQIGTINYQEEKIYLDSIAWAYDQLGQTTDKKEREAIQLKINALSIKAADYAIPNEFDKIINNMGGDHLNAFTGYEYIGYLNSFPATEMDKWLEVYSHRFINPVFRLFQSELETIYEEKNRKADNMGSAFIQDLFKEMFNGTPYGDQTILGSSEDLKNPSLSRMREYFETYYVPNNMALILTGDFNAESVKPLIKEKFAIWKAKTLPQENEIKTEPFKGRVQVNKRLLPIKVGVLGYHTVALGHPDELTLSVCHRLLSNYSSTGLLDELVNDNKLMSADADCMNFEELGGDFIVMIPKVVGQSLNKAEKMVLDEINKLKNGDFSDDLLEAVKLELITQNQQSIEDSRWRTYAIMNAFVYNQDWKDKMAYSSRINQISKDEVVKIANRYYGDNYLAFYSKMGFPKKDKIKKPPYKPVKPKNSEEQSTYAKLLEEKESETVRPHFLEEGSDFEKGQLLDGVSYYCVKNPINHIFSLDIKFSTGTNASIEALLAADILQYCGTKDLPYADFMKQLQKLGADYYVNANPTNFTLSLTGLENNLEPTLKLINDLISHPVFDEKEKLKLVREYKLNKKMNRKDIDIELKAMEEYVLYSNQSEYLLTKTAKDIKAMSVDDLLATVKNTLQKGAEFHYCGLLNENDFKTQITNNLTFINDLIPSDEYMLKSMASTDTNQIYFLNDTKAVQSHINLFVIANDNEPADNLNKQAFNAYFSGDMSSLIFQEIREFRSLAYAAYGYSFLPYDRSKPEYFKGTLGTQADKTIEALGVFTGLLNEMPEKPERMRIIKNNLKQSINNNRPGFRYITRNIPYWEYLGLDEDPNKLLYMQTDSLSFENVKDYYNKYIKNKKIIITIVGDKKRIDFDKLAQFGTVTELKHKDIFN